ncbi:hypothetical protein BV22DRAFT_1028412 [Leucogyrophana mollusca]|uniref:Uncharacterized protein n=1 Tax=Leucogyrophana mollusca TaxID=85980 RepID=A0ACB8C0B6_9AGAM|nr:hypothetical protein BV22DRAFT_1028412 [Leucogyrophana mollusca]
MPREYTVQPVAPEGGWIQPQLSPFPPPAAAPPAASATSLQGSANNPQPADPDRSLFYLCQFQMGGICERHSDNGALHLGRLSPRNAGWESSETCTMHSFGVPLVLFPL